MPNGPIIPADQIRTCNGSGLPPEAFKRTNYRSTDPGCRKLAQVNHYIVRDAASFVLKSARGSAHQAERDISRRYWRNRNHNAVQDGALAGRAAEIRAAMQELDARAGGRLEDLRQLALAKHQTWFQRLLADPFYRDLYAYCSQAA